MISTITMSPLQVVEGIATFRIAGICRLPHAVALISSAIDQAFEARHPCCLIDASDVDGFGSPSVATRHQMVRAWAQVARGLVTCALVVRPEVIDPQKIGVIAARNRGMQCDVFDNISDARDWLKIALRFPSGGQPA